MIGGTGHDEGTDLEDEADVERQSDADELGATRR